MTALKSVAYRIEWYWKQEGDWPLLYDHYSATTAPRAMNKFMRAMSEEYSNARRDIVIVAVYPTLKGDIL